MKKVINYDNSQQEWSLERRLKERGFVKTGDCFWCQTFKKNNRVIVLNRM